MASMAMIADLVPACSTYNCSVAEVFAFPLPLHHDYLRSILGVASFERLHGLPCFKDTTFFNSALCCHHCIKRRACVYIVFSDLHLFEAADLLAT